MLIKNYSYCFYANECKLKAIYIFNYLKIITKKGELSGTFFIWNKHAWWHIKS